MGVPRPRETLTLDQAARAALGGSYQALADGVTHYQLRGAAGSQTISKETAYRRVVPRSRWGSS